MTTRFDGAPLDGEDSKRHRRQIAVVANRTLQGKINAIGDVTLIATSAGEIDPDGSTARTTVADPLMSPQSTVFFDPYTDKAAQELAGGTLYVAEADRNAGSFTITHSAAVSTQRKFRYVILG